MEEILYKTSKNLKKEKVFNALKLLETYLPDVMKAVHEKLKTPLRNEWTENEHRKLKAAMEFFPVQEFIREPEERWRNVAGFVNSKRLNECKEEVELQEAIKLSKKQSQSSSKSGKQELISLDSFGLKNKEEKKQEVDEDEDEDDQYWDNQNYVTGRADKVLAAKNAMKNSVKTLIISEGKDVGVDLV